MAHCLLLGTHGKDVSWYGILYVDVWYFVDGRREGKVYPVRLAMTPACSQPELIGLGGGDLDQAGDTGQLLG